MIVLTSTSLSDQTVPGVFGKNAASAPDEIFRMIFVHLQNSYDEYRRLNAFRGIVAPSPDDRVWNPIGLQLVCLKWRGIAQPLYYNDQVALECTAERGTVQLTETLEFLKETTSIPIPRTIVLMVTDAYSMDLIDLSALAQLQSQLQVIASIPIGDAVDTACASELVSKLAVGNFCVISPRGDPLLGPSGRLPGRLERFDPPARLDSPGVTSADFESASRPHAITFRLAQEQDIDWALAAILFFLWYVEAADSICLLELRFEIPFALPLKVKKMRSLPFLTTPSSRKEHFLRLSSHRVKICGVSCGVVSKEAESRLRAGADAVGPLGVPFDIDVLDEQA